MENNAQKKGVKRPLTMVQPVDDVAFALNYAPARDRVRWVALWNFDERLAQIVVAAREPALAQIKLSWWRGQLHDPSRDAAIGHFGAALQPLLDGWEAALVSPATEQSLEAYARGRGGGLFVVLGGDARAGEGWALAELAARRKSSALMLAMAADRVSRPFGPQPKSLRILIKLARANDRSRWTLLRAMLG